MGVDSNVLMFERIRRRSGGQTAASAIELGIRQGVSHDPRFARDDADHGCGALHVRTGPIKGFAVSLSLGIIINLYSALVGTKVIFDIINSKWKLEKLSI